MFEQFAVARAITDWYLCKVDREHYKGFHPSNVS